VLVFVGMIQIETFFTCLLLVLFSAWLAYAQRPSWRNTILFALVLGFSTLSREMGIYFALLFLPGILWPAIRPGPGTRGRENWAKVALVLVVPLTVIGAWKARNYHNTGHAVWTSHTAFTEAWYFGPNVMAGPWDLTEEGARLRICEELVALHPEYESGLAELRVNPAAYWAFNNQVELNLRAVEVVRPYLLAHLPATARAFLGGAFWSLWGGVHDWNGIFMTTEEFRALALGQQAREAKQALFRGRIGEVFSIVLGVIGSLPVTVLMLFAGTWGLMIVLYGAALIGTLPSFRSYPLATLQLLALIAFAGFTAGPAGNSRLFVFAHPLLALLSARGLLELRSRMDP
jgi:hypothetical protein